MSATVMLQDAPGGPRLIEVLTKAAEDMALLYANTPDHAALAHLRAFDLAGQLAPEIGPGNAAMVLEKFAAVVMRRKRRLEALNASGHA